MLGCGKHNVQMGHARDHLQRLPIGTEIGKKGGSAGFQGRHWSSVVSQVVFTGFLTGSWLRRPPLEKWFHINGLRPLQGV